MSATAPYCPPLDMIIEVFATLPAETQDELLSRWLRRALRVLPPPGQSKAPLVGRSVATGPMTKPPAR